MQKRERRIGTGLLLKILLLVACQEISTAHAQQVIKKPVVDTAQYPWIHEEFNMIQFYDRDALAHFYQSWMSTGSKKMSIVHLGDSHLQSDIFPGQARKDLQAIHGDGGRGLIFPYSTAKTYSSLEYKTTHVGEWTYGKAMILPAKVPLGVVGMSNHTIDSNASFTFTFKDSVPATYTKLKIFVKKQHDSYDFVVEAGGKKIPVSVDSLPGDTLPYIEIELTPPFKELTVRLVRKNAYEKEFECYGMSLETADDKGVIFHNCGVGGARYQSILYENLFQQQLPTLDPDLVIIDFGTNDYLYDDNLKTDLDSEIVEVIKRVRAVAPQASIILTSTMDMYYRHMHVVQGEAFSNLVHRIAREQHCGVYDWYWIAGGWNVMPKWQNSGISQPDMIHLSLSGYRLKGNLLTSAMVNTMDWMKQNPNADSLVLFTDSISARQARVRAADTTDSQSNIPGRVLVKHRVKRGESLSVIAKKYHVTVAEIKKWNGLRSNMIHPGQILAIYKKAPVKKP